MKLFKKCDAVINETGQVRRRNRTLDPKRNDKMSTGQQIRCKTLVGSIRCPLWRNPPPLTFLELYLWWRLFQLSTAINHGQHVVPLGALTPFVHLLASEQPFTFSKWVNASCSHIMTVHHQKDLSRLTDANPPPVWLSLTLRVVHSFP
jgi:hypothetical protein